MECPTSPKKQKMPRIDIGHAVMPTPDQLVPRKSDYLIWQPKRLVHEDLATRLNHFLKITRLSSIASLWLIRIIRQASTLEEDTANVIGRLFWHNNLQTVTYDGPPPFVHKSYRDIDEELAKGQDEVSMSMVSPIKKNDDLKIPVVDDVDDDIYIYRSIYTQQSTS